MPDLDTISALLLAASCACVGFVGLCLLAASVLKLRGDTPKGQFLMRTAVRLSGKPGIRTATAVFGIVLAVLGFIGTAGGIALMIM